MTTVVQPEAPDAQSRPTDNILGSLITALGEDIAFKLIEARGGVRVYIPQDATHDHKIAAAHKLADVIGKEGVVALSKMFGGLTIPIPVARLWRVRVYRDRGHSQPEIARMVGCCEDTVWRSLRSMGMGMSGAVPKKVFA
jgi:hypothetical protein